MMQVEGRNPESRAMFGRLLMQLSDRKAGHAVKPRGNTYLVDQVHKVRSGGHRV